MAIYNSAFFPYKRRLSLTKRYMWKRPYSRNFYSHYTDGMWEGKLMPRNSLAIYLDRVHSTGYHFQKRTYYGY